MCFLRVACQDFQIDGNISFMSVIQGGDASL